MRACAILHHAVVHQVGEGTGDNEGKWQCAGCEKIFAGDVHSFLTCPACDPRSTAENADIFGKVTYCSEECRARDRQKHAPDCYPDDEPVDDMVLEETDGGARADENVAEGGM